ncbi:hypothetical protein vseg_005679 [Gypsophila vaccaria]
MGCAQSRIDNEEAVSRCKERRILMKEALLARTAFAVGHSAYGIALRNAGSALSDYGHGEAPVDPDTAMAVSGPPPPVSVPEPPPPPPPQEPLPPPPPPLPTFSPSPLQRSVTMPEFSVSKRGVSRMESLNEVEGDGEESVEGSNSKSNSNNKNISNNNNDINDSDISNNDSSSGIKGMAWDYFFMSENMHGSGLGEIDEEMEDDEEDDEEDEEEEEEEEDHLDHMRRRRRGHSVGNNEEIEFKTPEKAGGGGVETPPPPPDIEFRHIVHSNTAPPDVGRVSGGNKGENGNVSGSGGGGGGNKVDLVKVLEEIDDYFLKASECAQEVTKVLEAHKFQYHSNYADNRVPVDHAARVMRVITWNKALSMTEGGKDEFEDHETLATVLDKLMAWEKKLYEEVKAGELMKLEYQRKVGLLNKQKKRGAGAESVEKTKAAVSHLHTRYIVDMQSMDSTVAEVNELRDQQLYPKLVELVDEMAKMWENICVYHDTQFQVANKLRALDIMLAPRETTGAHHRCTIQLANVIQNWLEQFENMVNQQKQYVRHLHSWLKLNLIPLESSLKEKVSSPPRPKNPPIQSLLHAWHDSLEKLPDEVTKTAISSFGAVIKTIILHQEEEMKSKQTCEELRKEYLRKNQAFEDWVHKYIQRKGPEAMEPDRGEDGAAGNDPITDRRYVVNSLKKRLDDEMEKHQRQCVQVREKSLGTLKTRLPELFRALSEYSHACCDSYNKLRAIVLSHSSNGVSS